MCALPFFGRQRRAKSPPDMKIQPLIALAAACAVSLSAAPRADAAPKKSGEASKKKDAGKSKDKSGKKEKDKGKSAVASSPAAPKEKAAAPERPLEVHFDIQRAALDNGLRVVLAPDHGAATIGVSVTYDVGARNEEKGKTGFAHLFEHMMFQGSANMEKDQHGKLVTARGGILNGSTTKDRTVYFESLPSSELALA